MKFCTYDVGLMPNRKTEWAAWYDVCSSKNFLIRPNEIKLITTGVKMVLDEWTVWLVYLRSSMPLKKWLIIPNGVWVIDSDYRWEIWVEVMNTTKEDIIIEMYDRIWQIVIQKLDDSKIHMALSEESYNNFLENNPSSRWEGGFGSTWI